MLQWPYDPSVAATNSIACINCGQVTVSDRSALDSTRAGAVDFAAFVLENCLDCAIVARRGRTLTLLREQGLPLPPAFAPVSPGTAPAAHAAGSAPAHRHGQAGEQAQAPGSTSTQQPQAANDMPAQPGS